MPAFTIKKIKKIQFFRFFSRLLILNLIKKFFLIHLKPCQHLPTPQAKRIIKNSCDNLSYQKSIFKTIIISLQLSQIRCPKHIKCTIYSKTVRPIRHRALNICSYVISEWHPCYLAKHGINIIKSFFRKLFCINTQFHKIRKSS